LLGDFTYTAGFDSCLKAMTVTHVSKDGVTCSLPIDQAVLNSYGTLHGAAITTLIDVVGTMALMASDHTRGGVSVDMNVNFLNPAKQGETVTVTGKVIALRRSLVGRFDSSALLQVLKTGKTLGFTQVDVTRDSDGKLVATGRHTKFM
jgi:acyl-coenzyme A thioesterase 13